MAETVNLSFPACESFNPTERFLPRSLFGIGLKPKGSLSINLGNIRTSQVSNVEWVASPDPEGREATQQAGWPLGFSWAPKEKQFVVINTGPARQEGTSELPIPTHFMCSCSPRSAGLTFQAGVKRVFQWSEG